ncbi:MAG: NIPSNAP family protein [Usitatibacteraceae bacterium]
MIKQFAKVAIMASLLGNAPPERAIGSDAQIVELRQYQMVEGTRDAFIDFFEAKLLEPQEQDGMRLVGQFRDHADKDRFTWIRSFPDMASREKSLNAFYFGPVWKANRDTANPMLLDNDNVLLLKPASIELAFGPAQPRAPAGTPLKENGAVLAVIEYLWKSPDEGFAAFFQQAMKPAFEKGGLEVLGAYIPANEANTFPQLPVREEKKLLIWFVRGDSHDQLVRALKKVNQTAHWKTSIAPSLQQFEERESQQLWLDPTPRSATR